MAVCPFAGTPNEDRSLCNRQKLSFGCRGDSEHAVPPLSRCQAKPLSRGTVSSVDTAGQVQDQPLLRSVGSSRVPGVGAGVGNGVGATVTEGGTGPSKTKKSHKQ